MLRKLIIAVFVLGLVVALNGTAISDVFKEGMAPYESFNPDNPRFENILNAGPAQPSFKKPASALQMLPTGQFTTAPPLDYFCDLQDYTNGSPAYFWTIPDAYGDDLFNMRFTTEANYSCTLMYAHLLMYGTAMVGTPDLRVYLYDDDGFGFPGNKIDSVDIPNALLPTSGIAYVTADFSNTVANGGIPYVFENGEEYHYAWSIVQNDPGDVLAIISDDGTGPFAGEERASENYGGTWGTMLNDWGVDVSFFILSERCCSEIPYTDCYWGGLYDGFAYFWRAPHPTWGDEAYAMRFLAATPETLQFVDVYIYDDGVATSGFGTLDATMTLYADDGTGLPGAVITSQTLAGGSYAAGWNTFTFNEIVTGDFHLAFSSNAVFGTGEYLSCLSDDGTTPHGASSSYWAGGPWVDMASGWGLDADFVFDPFMCKDEYSLCSINYCYTGLNYLWRLPDAYGDVGEGQKIAAASAGSECRPQEVSIAMFWSGSTDYPTMYSYNTDVSINPDVAGLPGPAVATITLTPADYAAAGLTGMGVGAVWVTVDFNDLAYVSGDYWVTINSLAPDPTTGIRVISDAGGGPCVDTWVEDWGGGNWHLMTDGWGVGADWTMALEAEHCCVPYTGRVCGTPTDFPTLMGNMARDGATFVELDDPQCDLTLDWNYQGTDLNIWAGPVIYGDYVVQSFTDEYRIFDLSGTEVSWSPYNPQAGPFVAGDLRCSPTIATVSTYPNPIMFCAGGSNNETHAVDFVTGVKIWSHDVTSVGPAHLYGNTRWGVYTVVGDNVYWGTDDGYVVAADAATGAFIWTPEATDLVQATWKSGASDGSALFYSTRSTAVEGDIYSLSAATGAINWQLSATAGLQGSLVYASYTGDEGFTGGVSYDADFGYLYAGSRCDAGDHPTGGLIYRLRAGTGALVGPVTLADRTLYATPIVDKNRIYCASFNRWASPPQGGDLFAVNKFTGGVDWATSGGPDAFPFDVNGALSCEPEPDPDFLFTFTYNGFLLCTNAETGEQVYRRRSEPNIAAYTRGQHVALAVDPLGEPVMAVADFQGNLAVFRKSINDRSRLQIETYNPTASVEFGPATSLPVFIYGVFTNTGCANLNITSSAADEISFSGSTPPGYVASNISSDIMDRADKIADNLAREAYLSKFIRPSEISDDILASRDNNLEKINNRAAAGFPPFLNSVTHPVAGDVIIPGGSLDIELDVIQAAINRGPQPFYLQICSDDPDYFIDDVSKCPEVYITLVGGCLIDTTTLHFGVGSTNEELVTNTGRLGTGDWGDGDAGHNGFLIDGDGASYYQGSYAFGVSQYEVATNTQDWTSGGGEADAMISLQPDPNWCDNNCKAFLDAGVTLGYITSDGITYSPILGNMVCKSFIDSVQNFDLGAGWDWENWTAPFDNSLTMGLYTNGSVVGAVDVPELANLTVEVLEITERNGNPVNGWKMWEFWDCDNGGDTVAIDKNISSAWAYNPSSGAAWGQIKIPFGCGYDPIVNTVGLYGASGTFGFWAWNVYWDSAYGYAAQTLGAPAGTTPGHYSYNMSAGDGEAMATLASHDFVGGETYKIGIAHFGALTFTDPTVGTELAPLAIMVNQWCGFGRGDGNNDGVVNLADIIYIANAVNGGPGGVPFAHLLDVNNDTNVDIDDVTFMIDFYFNGGACPVGDFVF